MDTALHDAWKAFRLNPAEEAFTPLFEATRGLVWSICWRILRNEEDALDAFQSTYTRLLAEARAGAAPDDGGAIRIAAVREADSLRKRRSRRLEKETAMETLPDSPDPSGHPAEAAARRERHEAIERLIARLPDARRIPILLHFFHEMSHREIAKALGLPVGTVTSRIKSGLRDLDQPMRKAGLGPAAAGVAAAGALAAATGIGPSPALAAGLLFTRAEAAAAAVSLAEAGAGGGLLAALGSTAAILFKTPAVTALTLACTALITVTGITLYRVAEAQSPDPAATAMTNGGRDAISFAKISPTPNTDRTASLPGAKLNSRTASNDASNGDAMAFAGLAPSTETSFRPKTNYAPAPTGDPLWEPRHRIFGRVVYADTGEPFPRAHVRAIITNFGGRPWRTVSDERGDFEIAGLPAKDFEVLGGIQGVSRNDDFQGFKGNVSVPLDQDNIGPVTIKAPRGWPLTIRAIEAKGNSAPIAGGRIWLEAQYAHYIEATTDEAGEASFTDIPADRFTIHFVATGHAWTTRQIRVLPQASNTHLIEAEPGGTVRGHLTLPAGAVGKDIEMSLSFWKSDGLPIIPPFGILDIPVADDGAYRFDFVPLDATGMRVSSLYRAADRAQSRDIDVSLDGLTAENPVMVADLPIPWLTPDSAPPSPNPTPTPLPSNGMLAGFVIDETGAPVVGAEVSTAQFPIPDMRRAITGANGDFRLDGLEWDPTGSWPVPIWTRSTGYAPERSLIDGVKALADDGARITLRRGGSFGGRILDEKGNPVPKATISITQFYPDTERAMTQGEANPDGSFLIEHLADLPGAATASAPGTQSRALDLHLGEEHAAVMLRRKGILVGNVVDADTGRPVKRFQLDYAPQPQALRLATPGGIMPALEGWGYTPQPGLRFRQDGTYFESETGYLRIDSGIYAGAPMSVTLFAEGYPAQAVAGLIPTTEEEVHPATLRLTSAKRAFNGTVRRKQDGEPAANVTLTLLVYGPNGRPITPFAWDHFMRNEAPCGFAIRSTTGSDGTFSFENLPASGVFDLVGTGEGLARRRITGLESLTNDEAQALAVEFDPEARLQRSASPPPLNMEGILEINKRDDSGEIEETDSVELYAVGSEFEGGGYAGGNYLLRLHTVVVTDTPIRTGSLSTVEEEIHLVPGQTARTTIIALTP